MKDLIKQLNDATIAYNEGHPIMSDKEWDDLYFKLVEEEKDTGTIYPNSPTQSITFEYVSELKKVEHNHPMLSLDKTKSVEEVASFLNTSYGIVMGKMDGLTCSLFYKNGFLQRAETRGNGIIGEDITHNAKVIPSIPQQIDFKGELIVDGEIICTYKDFEQFKEIYKNPRNFASGSIRLLDSKECANRHLTFVAWDVVKGGKYDYLSNNLLWLKDYGFARVPFSSIQLSFENKDLEFIEAKINLIKILCKRLSYPIDGVVFKYDNIATYNAAGRTDHHFKGGLAYKFYDETYETKLINIEWSMSRLGQLSPIAVFETLNIDGTEISKASLSNLTIMKKTLGEHPFKGQILEISKRNQIIPKVERAKGENGKWII